MRLIGLVISLALIMWVLFKSSGGDNAEEVIPEVYKQSMEKAEDVEQALQDATQLRLEQMDKDMQ